MPIEITTTNNAFRVPTSANNGTDFGAGLADFATDVDKMWQRGTLVSRPAASIPGRYYLATDDTSSGSSIGTLYFDTGAAWVSGFNPPSRGAANIATSQSTSSTTYTTLATPDQVTGIVLPTNGLIRVWYQATWSQAIDSSARAAIFLGGNQVKVADYDGSPATIAAAATSTAGNFLPLASCPYGLVSGGGSNAYSGDVTTGQVVGVTTGNFNVNVEYNGTVVHPYGSATSLFPPMGGPCDIFAAAGTYTIGVQFKVVAGTSITVKNRQLWVQAIAFS